MRFRASRLILAVMEEFMPKRRIFIPIILLLIVIISLVTYWYLTTQKSTTASGSLTGSGTVETTTVTISPELAGRVAEVLVAEGDHVNGGDTLFKLDSTLMNSQLNQGQVNLNAAQAGLNVAHEGYAAALVGVNIAQAQYNLALAQALQQAQPARTSAWQQPEPDRFNQPAWYYSHAEQLTAALDELNASRSALEAEEEICLIDRCVCRSDINRATPGTSPLYLNA
jgi:multidrug efflux pump subunit AcrA (membrane-fusion protein)